MSKVCCYGCEKRTLGCHSTCKEYEDWQRALREKRQVEHNKRLEQSVLNDYQIGRKEKMKKGKRL